VGNGCGDGHFFLSFFIILPTISCSRGHEKPRLQKAPLGKVLLPILDVNGCFYVRFKEIYQHSDGYNEQHKNRRNATAKKRFVHESPVDGFRRVCFKTFRRQHTN
jgi:hypothetical protein